MVSAIRPLFGFYVVVLSATAVAAAADVKSVYPVCSLSGDQNAVYWWIPESLAAGSIVNTLPIQGISGEGESQEIALRLVNGSDWFALNTTTKDLVLKKQVDREADVLLLEAIVECKSLLLGDNFQVNIPVRVKVQDSNDNAPEFSQKVYYFNITEELPPGTPVFNGLSATDRDQLGPNTEIQYSIAQDSEFSNFLEIPNPWDGTIVVKDRIDFEKLKNFSIIVKANDHGEPILESEATVFVNVIDSDDLNPIFEYPHYTARVSANDTINSILPVLPSLIKAKDQDTLNEPVIYTLEGNYAEKFEIHPKSGILRLRDNVHLGEKYLLTVWAQQERRPERSSQSTLMVLVQGQNPNEPTFEENRHRIEVLENIPVGSLLTQIRAKDQDENSVLAYKFKNPEFQNNPFNLDPLGGDLTLKIPLDFEMRNGYQLYVVATDGLHSIESVVEIVVLDVNDNNPEFLTDFYRFTPSFDDGNQIGSVQAVDKDVTDQIKYSLLNLNQSFSIDDSGVIRVKNKQMLKNISYDIVVRAKDNGIPSRESFVTVKVDLANSTAPVIVKKASSEVSLIPISEKNAVYIIFGLIIGCALLALFALVLIVYLCRARQNQARLMARAKSMFINDKIDRMSTLPRISTVTDQYPNRPAASNTTVGRSYQNSEGVRQGPNGLRTEMISGPIPHNNTSDNYVHDGRFPYSNGSPHGSHSPLDEHGIRQDRSLEVEYETSSVMPSNAHANDPRFRGNIGFAAESSGLSFEGPGISGTLLPTQANHYNTSTASAMPQVTISNRPPLTVYF